MQIREFDGRRATNRRGAAEYLGRSVKTINRVASPSMRSATGWPEPVAVEGREQWYALADLDAFRDTYVRVTEAAHLPRVHQITLDGDPEELLTAAQFRELLQASKGTWSRYVHDSRPAWDAGQDGYLPRPDAEEPARRGVHRLWRRRRIQEWINNRRGKVPSPGRPAANRDAAGNA